MDLPVVLRSGEDGFIAAEFLERLNGAGDIVPELLIPDPVTQAIIRDHPGLKWKALNVKKRLGVPAEGDEPA